MHKDGLGKGNPEAEQRLARAKLESLEGGLLYTVAMHVIDLRERDTQDEEDGELPNDKGGYFVGE